MKTAIVVGTSRSGTSMASAFLNLMGADWAIDAGGKKDDEQNPKGCYEHITPITIDMNIGSKDCSQDIRNFLNNLYKSEADIVGWKSSPRGIKEYLPYVKFPHVVIPFRNIIGNSKSGVYHHKMNYNREMGLLQSMKYYLDAQAKVVELAQYLDGHGIPILLIEFEEMKYRPISAAIKMAGFLGIKLTTEKMDKITEFVMPDYCSWETVGYKINN